MADVKFSQLLAQSPASVAALAALVTPKGAINGLTLEWVSGTSLRVTSGAAVLESLGYLVDVSAAITKSGLSLAASTWHHVYLYLNAGAPDVEIVTTAPATPYRGSARSKTGDPSRRYLGSVKTDASGALFNFLQDGVAVMYRGNPGTAPHRVLAGGSATTETTVSLAAVVPVTARFATARVMNLDPSAIMRTGTSDDSNSGPPASSLLALTGTEKAFLPHPLDSSQALTYWYETTPAGGNAYLDVYGYTYAR